MKRQNNVKIKNETGAAHPGPSPRFILYVYLYLLIILLGCLLFSCTGAPPKQPEIQPETMPEAGEKPSEAVTPPFDEPEPPAITPPEEPPAEDPPAEELPDEEPPPEEPPVEELPAEEAPAEEPLVEAPPDEELPPEEPPVEEPPAEEPPAEEPSVEEPPAEKPPPEEPPVEELPAEEPPSEEPPVEELPAEESPAEEPPVEEPPVEEPEPVIEKIDPPSGLTFSSAPLPALHSMPGVGYLNTSSGDRVSSLSTAEKAELTGAFRAAYQDALIRDLPLRGALGGDLVHGWPASAPLGWVQNWRSTRSTANSWGLPTLVLAVGGLTRDKVYALSGPILDQYGKSGGVNRTNGVPGYGVPLTGEFLFGDGIAQRFVHGLITVDGSGKSAFHAEEAPSSRETPPPSAGLYSGAYPPQSPETPAGLRRRFLAAWNAAVDSGIQPLIPDGPVRYAGLRNAPWTIGENRNRSIKLDGFYYQTYNGETSVFILGLAPELPPYPRLVSGPILDLLLAWAHPIPGAETLQDEALYMDESRSDDAADFIKALIRGMGIYGFPVSDSVPRQVSEGSLLPAQRFSKGWIMETGGREAER
ncbi:MAG: hypothetical protein LBP76_03745 [Treponema sp.]|jgi:hypothetical protein|nr:hypothetical protein [Treponema sp.]